MIGIEEKDMIINRIPAKTWNHLHMNQSKVGEVVINRTGELNASVNDADVGHEATIGRISDDAVFYLMSRGIPEDDARAMIVSGFADNVSKELPLEYAMEMNNLIKLEMKGSIG